MARALTQKHVTGAIRRLRGLRPPTLRDARGVIRDEISRLPEYRWFARCGEPLASRVARTARRAQTWSAALASLASVEWDNHLIELKNAFGAHVDDWFGGSGGRYNDVAAVIMTTLMPPLTASCVAALEAQALPRRRLLATAEFVVGHAVMERVYAPVRPPPAFGRLATLLRMGHLPCGWNARAAKPLLVL